MKAGASMDKYMMIKALFEKNQDQDNAVKMSKYLRDQFLFYGIPSPKRKALYKDFLKQEKKNKKIDWDFLDCCYRDEHREFQYFVCDYLSTFKNILVYEDISHMKIYLKQKQWWDTIDSFDTIIGNIGLRDNRVDDLMLEWSKDDDFWLRRIAIDHQLGRKEKTNTDLLEKIICNNFGSHEFFINKAIGWILRDYSKTNPLWVKQFIEKYHEYMSNLSIREASKYL